MMNFSKIHFAICFGIAILLVSCNPAADIAAENDGKTVVAVEKAHFLAAGFAEAITIVPCTLSTGSDSECYRLVSKNVPPDHKMGPWCPKHITDGPDKGGIWLEHGHVHDVDGAFIEKMDEFYKDEAWMLYDADGNVKVTDTQKACEAAARPDVDPEYRNHCVECLPAYVAGITQTYLIPVKPVRLVNSAAFGRGPRAAVSVRGVAFNGVRFDAPAPTYAILAAHTLAPFDDAGGHINPHAGYHYHAATGKTKEIAQPDDHAPMIGYALDGHGLYAQLDAQGNEPEGLDDCRGHYDETRGYHYHVAEPGANNFLNCLNGAYARE